MQTRELALEQPAEDDRYAAVRQYSLRQIIGVWAAAAVSMGLLAQSVVAIGVVLALVLK